MQPPPNPGCPVPSAGQAQGRDFGNWQEESSLRGKPQSQEVIFRALRPGQLRNQGWMWLPDSPFSAGLWSLSYEQELTTPLHITASRGYADCLQLLLLRGAAVNFAPGGKTALHEACVAASTDCVRLLLSFGADPEAVSEDGYKPLHLCKSPDSIK